MRSSRAPRRLAAMLAAAASLTACVHASHDDAPPPAEHHAAPHWDYEGPAGPTAWGTLAPEYRSCAGGHRQSPIDLDIAHAEAAALPPLTVHYGATAAVEVNNGHTIQDQLPPGEWVELGGTRYQLEQFHFHHASEHTLNGAHFPLEVHLVHRSATGALLVVGVLVAEGAEHPALRVLFDRIPHDHESTRLSIDPEILLPDERRYVTYEGSLTTPPCTEGVTWVVLTSPVAASADQIQRFSALFPNNSRPVRPLEGRHVRASQR